ncbi:MAG: DUF4054 domain-containing protein [Bradymonadaceae bacterium]
MSAHDLLIAIAPELATESEARIDTFLELAAQRVGAHAFGKVYVQAVTYLAAHLLTLSNRARDAGMAAAGSITSVGTGGLSVSFGQAAGMGDESLSSTVYGLEFLELRDSRPSGKGRLIIP